MRLIPGTLTLQRAKAVGQVAVGWYRTNGDNRSTRVDSGITWTLYALGLECQQQIVPALASVPSIRRNFDDPDWPFDALLHDPQAAWDATLETVRFIKREHWGQGRASLSTAWGKWRWAFAFPNLDLVRQGYALPTADMGALGAAWVTAMLQDHDAKADLFFRGVGNRYKLDVLPAACDYYRMLMDKGTRGAGQAAEDWARANKSRIKRERLGLPTPGVAHKIVKLESAWRAKKKLRRIHPLLFPDLDTSIRGTDDLFRWLLRPNVLRMTQLLSSLPGSKGFPITKEQTFPSLMYATELPWYELKRGGETTFVLAERPEEAVRIVSERRGEEGWLVVAWGGPAFESDLEQLLSGPS
jgi:hypothetical protein